MNWVEHERAPGWIEYRLGVYGSRDGYVTVDVSATGGRDADLWDIHLHVCGACTIQEITGLAVAKELALHLYETLMPHAALARARSDARYAEMEARRKAEAEASRPAREKAARELAARLAKAPVAEAPKCPECGHIGEDEDDFGTPGYECSRCGSTGRGADGRRCDSCHIFRARTTDLSCPDCEAPLESTETVSVKWDGSDPHEVS